MPFFLSTQTNVVLTKTKSNAWYNPFWFWLSNNNLLQSRVPIFFLVNCLFKRKVAAVGKSNSSINISAGDIVFFITTIGMLWSIYFFKFALNLQWILRSKENEMTNSYYWVRFQWGALFWSSIIQKLYFGVLKRTCH